MANILALPVSMKSFKLLGTSVSPDATICVRGRHAIGKSEGVYQIARAIKDDFYKSEKWINIKRDYADELPEEIATHSYEDGLPVVERRLSQLSEGDIVGLPFMHQNARTGDNSTSFEPVDWLMLSVEFPVMLFLDERNRALEGVKQAVFQLTDSKAFYGKKLHANTRIIVAENIGDSYQVQSCDPAEVSRCMTVTLDPSVAEWIAYAKDYCHEATIEYIRVNQSDLEHLGSAEPNKKYADRRSWFKLDAELARLDLFDNYEQIFYVLACASLGQEVGTKFAAFVRDREKNVTSTEILKDWDKAKTRLGGKENYISNEMYVATSAKLADHIVKKKLNEKQAVQFARFMFDAPPEIRTNLFASLSKSGDNLFRVYAHIKQLMIATSSAEDITSLPKPGDTPIAQKTPVKGKKAKAPVPRKRGGRR